jgi:hypothetical protein
MAGTSSSRITSLLAWEKGRDFIKQNYITPGMGEGPGLHQSVLRRDCTWRIYHYIFERNITIKFGFSLSREGHHSSGKSAPFVMVYKFWQLRKREKND